jgi:TRAP-type C4-dicarboxylate transport system substrate-binding protein
MSLKTWNKLSDAQKELVKNAAQEAAEFERGSNNKSEAEWLELVKQNGMEVTTPDTEGFRKTVESVYAKYGPQFGEELIQKILDTK